MKRIISNDTHSSETYPNKKAPAFISLLLALMLAFTGCAATGRNNASASSGSTIQTDTAASASAASSPSSEAAVSESSSHSSSGTSSGQADSSADASREYTAVTTAVTASGGIYSGTDLFTDRDLTQTADLSEAVYYTLSDNENLSITSAGVYVLSGTASNVTFTVDAASEDKVQIVLDNVSVTNTNAPFLYVKSADKVFVTTAEGSGNSLSVTGTFTADGTTNLDGVIFSKDDLVLSGLGTLTITSTENGIVCKDDLKITGGTYIINASSKCLEANDSIRIAGGTLTLTAGTDGLHAENDEDDSIGYVYICGGSLTVKAGDDGIHATTVVQIDGGTIAVSAAEGIEGTYLQINGGEITVAATDDGVNAARKSTAYTPTFEMNGGTLSVTMGQGDTDGIDSNGNIIINGGTISVTASSSFDCDGTATYNGGTIIVNGQQVNYIPNQAMGGRGGMGGQMGRR